MQAGTEPRTSEFLRFVQPIQVQSSPEDGRTAIKKGQAFVKVM